MTIGFLSTFALIAALVPLANCQAASNGSWDGTWSGMLNNKEPVSVTIAAGKVVSYAIRGVEPFPIGFNSVTTTAVSFGDSANYAVSIKRTGGRSALGTAHGQMGNGSASLTRQ
jgi:hypothetical protein